MTLPSHPSQVLTRMQDSSARSESSSYLAVLHYEPFAITVHEGGPGYVDVVSHYERFFHVSWSSLYQVLHISDGLAALKMVRTLILLDYLLPDMDGLECLDRLRESKGMCRLTQFSAETGLNASIAKHGEFMRQRPKQGPSLFRGFFVWKPGGYLRYGLRADHFKNDLIECVHHRLHTNEAVLRYV